MEQTSNVCNTAIHVGLYIGSLHIGSSLEEGNRRNGVKMYLLLDLVIIMLLLNVDIEANLI